MEKNFIIEFIKQTKNALKAIFTNKTSYQIEDINLDMELENTLKEIEKLEKKQQKNEKFVIQRKKSS